MGGGCKNFHNFTSGVHNLMNRLSENDQLRWDCVSKSIFSCLGSAFPAAELLIENIRTAKHATAKGGYYSSECAQEL